MRTRGHPACFGSGEPGNAAREGTPMPKKRDAETLLLELYLMNERGVYNKDID